MIYKWQPSLPSLCTQSPVESKVEATLKKMLLKRFNQVLNPRLTALCQQEEIFREPLGLADTKKGSERRVN